MTSSARTYLAFAATMAISAACGDDVQTVVDAGPTRDAPATDTPIAVDAALDAATDAATDGAVVEIDAAPPIAMWRGAQVIEHLPDSARVPVAGMDAAGRAIVLWINNIQDADDETISRGELRVAHYDPATGWGAPIALTPPPTESSFLYFSIDLAVNASGEAMAVWFRHSDGDGIDLLARRYTPAGGWLPPTVLFDGTPTETASYSPHVAMAPDGSAVVTWSRRPDLDHRLYARHFDPATGWGASTLVHYSPRGDALGHDVAMDARGHAVAVWTVRAGGGQAFASRFAPDTGWSTPVALAGEAAAGGNFDVEYAQLAVGATGDAVVALEVMGDTSMVWGVVGTADGAWQAATRLEDADRYANSIGVAADANGAAIVVWQSWPVGPGGADPRVRSRRYVPGSGWGAITPVASSAERSSSPAIAMSPTGIATAVWTQADAGIWANRFVPATGWGTPVPLSSVPTGGYDEPAVAAGADASAIATWPHVPDPVDNHPRPFDLWANVYR